MKKFSTITIISSLLLCLLANPSFSQSDKTIQNEGELKKNAIYIEATYGVSQIDDDIYYGLYLKYDYIFGQNIISKNISSFVEIGIGSQFVDGGLSNSMAYLSSIGLIYSFGSHHAVFNLGLLYAPEYEKYRGKKLELYGKFGYRFQSPKRPVFLKLRVGYPELISLGIGFSF